MANYQGPDRRSLITFTREDSDRLVRLEQQLLDNGKKMDTVIEKLSSQDDRIGKLENKQSWFVGIFTTVVAILSAVVGLFHKSL
jgi:hypothetical protein